MLPKGGDGLIPCTEGLGTKVFYLKDALFSYKLVVRVIADIFIIIVDRGCGALELKQGGWPWRLLHGAG